MNHRPRRVARRFAVAVAAICASAASIVPIESAHAAALTKYNGARSDVAAPSCWAIKQSFPHSRDGLYWLLTPAMVRPQVFYCDMTTDGGGWVLIGRGRDGWSFDWAGQGDAASVARRPTGTAAFAPATVSSSTVEALLNGHALSTAFDGVRIRRAANTAGTSWQEARLHLAFAQHFTWEWQLGQPLTTATFGSRTSRVGPQTTHLAGSTYDVRLDSGAQVIHTGLLDKHLHRSGFAYGAAVRGMASSRSYLWAATNGGTYALPFTQVFIRPRFGDHDLHFRTIPTAGLAAQARAPFPSNIAQRADWGVGELQRPASDPDPAGKGLVYALAQVGNTMFVGGKFARVEHHSTRTVAEQPWLAAFDVETGVWVRTFLPTLDGAVFDLVASPDGKLIVAGNFTNINGAPNTSGLAKIDPITGDVVSGWRAALTTPKFDAPRAYATSAQIGGNWLYVTGGFKQVAGAHATLDTGGVARVALADGAPDLSWHPYVNGLPVDITPSADGTRVDVVGSFTTSGTTPSNGVAADGVAVLDATTGAVTGALVPHFDGLLPHGQLAVVETNSLLVHGGNQHWLAGYNRSDLAFRRGTMMAPHGDIQVLMMANGVLFGGCHCYDAVSFTDAPARYTGADSINWLGAWNPNTLERNPAFAPQFAASAAGVWELALDSRQCLWAGGDIVHGATTADWLGGFARFCPGDITPPTTPGALTIGGGKLWWPRSHDNGGAPSYEVLRNDRVVAVTASNRIVPPGHGVYFVRAIDAAGNRSATTRGIWV